MAKACLGAATECFPTNVSGVRGRHHIGVYGLYRARGISSQTVGNQMDNKMNNTHMQTMFICERPAELQMMENQVERKVYRG